MSKRKNLNNNQLTEETWKNIQELINDIYIVDQNNDQQYWHYTSVNGLLGIFDDYIKNYRNSMDIELKRVKECSVFASNIRFMNDSKEYEEGNELYSEFCERYGTSDGCREELNASQNAKNDNIYLISFCGNGDLLSQWKWYGKDSGVAIRFNLDNTIYKTFSYVTKEGKQIEEDDEWYDDKTKPISVRYNKESKKKLFSDLLKNKRINDANAFYLVKPVFVPFCKDEGFAEERESRLVFYYAGLREYGKRYPKFNFVYNKSEAGRVKPALNVKFTLKDKSDVNIISEIIVGPGINQESVFNLLIHIFDREHYSYQTSSVEKKDKVLTYNQFLKKNDHQMHRVNFTPLDSTDDNKIIREAYMCENGIIIEKSTLPFRG